MPRVLHGGSGNKDSEVAESIRYGVGKINIFSDMKKAFFVALEQELKQGGHEPDSMFTKPMHGRSSSSVGFLLAEHLITPEWLCRWRIKGDKV
nr:class II fructose-bisphosphate aldolase [Pantoea agglomerans]